MKVMGIATTRNPSHRICPGYCRRSVGWVERSDTHPSRTQPRKTGMAGTELVLGQAFGPTRGAGHDDWEVLILGEFNPSAPWYYWLVDGDEEWRPAL